VAPIDTAPSATGLHRTDGNGARPRLIESTRAVAGKLPGAAGPALGSAAVITAIALAASPLASGYFNFSVWGPLALGALVVLVVVALTARTDVTRYGILAAVGLGGLLVLSAASLLWAESTESTWTEINRLAFYAALFAIVLFTVRDRRTGRLVVLILGSGALLTSLILTGSFLLGHGQGAFLGRRLDSPIGYINGTAGLLVIGIWPWIAYAETASRRMVRAASLAAAALIAGTCVLTESRAIVPASALTGALVLLCAPERARRLANLALVAVAVTIGLPATLRVYSNGGAADRLLAPSPGVLRAAAAAIVLGALVAGAARYWLPDLVRWLRSRCGPVTLRRLRTATIMGVICVVAAGAVAGGPFIARQYREFTALRVNQNSSVRFIDASGFRYDLWRVALREFETHPLGGLGAGNYDVEYYRLRNNPEYVTQPHSLELELAADLGIGGVLALLLFCGATFAAGFARRGTLASEDRLIKVAALGMFAAFLIDTSVDWLYDIPGLAGIAIVAAALLVVPAGSRAKRDRPSREGAGRRRLLGRIAPVVLCLAAVAVLAASIGRQYVASRYASNGTGEITRSPQKALGTLHEALSLDPYALTTLYSIAAAYAQLDDYADARDALLLAARREPHNYVPPALLGDLALRRGLYTVALAQYRHALTLNPRDPDLIQAEHTAESLARA
jgi:O-Antigen ligase